MKNEIEKLIVKYEDKSLEEPAYYFQYIEFIEDLKSLLELCQSQQEVAPESIGLGITKEIPTIHNTIYRIGEK